MDDRALYATILGIAPPWQVSRVELDDAAKAVHGWLEERAERVSRVRSAARCRPRTTTSSGAGGTSTPTSTRPASMGACRASNAPSTA